MAVRPLVPLALLLAPLLLAGCAEDAPGSGATPPPGSPGAGAGQGPVEAPWWNVGESWTLRYTQGDKPERTTTLAVFANHTFGDPPHFWLGTKDRQEALDHVFFDDNMFLGRIHWTHLAPHEKGRHSTMYAWPLEDGKRFDAHAFGRDWRVTATAREGGFDLQGTSPDGARIRYDYDLANRWFGRLQVTDADGKIVVDATVTDHKLSSATGTWWFLRGRDYLDSAGGAAGTEESFTVEDEGATSIAFLLDDVQTSLAATIEFVDPKGEVYHREAIRAGETRDKVVEVPKPPTPGDWTIRYLGTVQGTILVRGIVEYTATL